MAELYLAELNLAELNLAELGPAGHFYTKISLLASLVADIWQGIGQHTSYYS